MKNKISFLIVLLLTLLVYVSNNLIVIIIPILYSIFISIKVKDFNLFMKLLFVIYLLSLFYLTIFTSSYKRTIFDIEFNLNFYKEYLIDNCNFIPFKTISFYIKNIFVYNTNVDTKVILLNLFGNLVCFVPLIVFLPFFWKRFRTKKQFCISVTIFSLCIELLQFITMAGSFDIDDIILNSFGAILFYFCFFKEINLFCNKDLFTKKNNYNELLIFGIKIIVLVLLIGTILFFSFKRFKDENTYWLDQMTYKIKLLNYSDVCKDNDERNKIYEDDTYEYYINCSDINKIIILINDTEYKLIDYLNGKTKYDVRVNALLDAGMVLEKQPKGKELKICTKSKEPNILYANENDEIAVLELFKYGYEEKLFCNYYYIIAKEEGNTKVIFEINGEGLTEEYNIFVDENNNIEYTKQ